jgi:protoporphyrinogen oxidase
MMGSTSDLSETESLPKKYEAIVLGAGISGLVTAILLIRQGYKSIIIADTYESIGGNHIDIKIGEYTFDVGTFIFQDDSPLLRHFPDIVSLYTTISPTVSRVTPRGSIHAYPISPGAEILAAGPVEWLRIAISLVLGRTTRRSRRNAADFLHFWIGRRLAAISGVENYVRRFYGVPADLIDINFAEKRMGWIADAASLKKRLARLMGYKDPWNTTQSFVRPREGFAHLYKAAGDRIAQGGGVIRLGQHLLGIRRIDDHFMLSTSDGEIEADEIVSTIPLHQTLALCGLPNLYPLPTLTLVTLFFSFEGERGFDTYILYNFSDSGAWKRLTMFSDAYGRIGGREYFGVEINHDGGAPAASSEAAAKQDAEAFMADIRDKGLFKGDLKLEGHHILNNAYPVYVHGAAEHAAQAIAALKAFGIRSIGRQGGFDYLPTARQTTLVVEEALLGRHGPYDNQPII